MRSCGDWGKYCDHKPLRPCDLSAPSKKKPTKKKHQSLKRGDTETTTRETVWTTKDVAALTIQTLVRGWLSRREAARRRMERDDYEALMDRLEKEVGKAFLCS